MYTIADGVPPRKKKIPANCDFRRQKVKRARLDLRVREEEKEDWQGAAQSQGITLSELVRRRMLPYSSKKTRATAVVPSK